MIEVIEGTDIVNHVPFYRVTVAGYPCAAFWCQHAAEHAARRIAVAREGGHRVAMRIFTEEFGMCDEYAEHLYSNLFGPSHSTLQ